MSETSETPRERKLVTASGIRNRPHGWISVSERLPTPGQEVYYFGPVIGLHIGKFDPTVETKGWAEGPDGEDIEVELPEQVVAAINHNKFRNNDWGVVDTDDCPWWMPYDPERAKSWCPLPPDYVIPY